MGSFSQGEKRAGVQAPLMCMRGRVAHKYTVYGILIYKFTYGDSAIY